MGKITVVNKRSAKRSLLKLAVVGALVAGTYAGGNRIYTHHQQKHLKEQERIKAEEIRLVEERKKEEAQKVEETYRARVGQVGDALARVDLRLAQELLDKLEREETIRGSDAVTYRRALNKAIEEYNFWDALGKKDFMKARESAALMKGTGLHSAEEVQSFERRIYEETEEGLLEKISKSAAGDKENLCREYLGKYPSGKGVGEMRKTLLQADAATLCDCLQARGNLQEFYEKLQRVNSHLEGMVEKDVGSLALGEIAQQCEVYLADKQRLPGALEIGAKVATRAPESKKWHPSYVTSRLQVFPSGSVGTIIHSYMDNSQEFIYVVNFPKINKTAWPTQWDSIEQYRKNGWNVAEYHGTEIEALPVLNVVTRDPYIREIQRLKNNLKGVSGNAGNDHH